MREFGKPVETLDWGIRVRDPDAMELITPEEVLDKIAQVIGDSAHTPDTQKDSV